MAWQFVGKNRDIPIRLGGGSWSSYWANRYISALSVLTTSDTEQIVTATLVGSGYSVSFEVSTDNITFTEHGTSTTGIYLATGLTPYTLYYWRARPTKSGQYGTYSDVDSDTTETPAILEDGNTVGWYDSQLLSTVTKDGSDLVSAWADKLGGVNTLLAAAGDEPLWSLNGILFDGVDKFMRIAFTFNQPEFIYMIVKPISWTANDYIFNGINTNTGALYQYSATPTVRGYAGAALGVSSDLTLGEWHIVRVLWNGASSRMTIDDNAPVTGNAGASNMGGFSIGGNTLTSGWSHIEVKEIILRKSADNAENEEIINNYLKKKYDWYGVTIDQSSISPTLTRIANNMGAHASLPVQSLIKGCLVADDGTVNYYLKADDWTLQADGVTASNLDGTDGQVMIEIPQFYYKLEKPSTGVYQHKISLYSHEGFTEIPKFYVGAYEAALSRSTSKLASLKNTAADYRGGENQSAWDAGDNTLLGKPATYISPINFRTYARNRGVSWNLVSWKQSRLLRILYMIEYASLNSQAAVDATLTADGYKQGGLGAGVSTLNTTEWTNFNNWNPVIPCGSSDALANGSGEVDYSIPNFGTTAAVKVPRYRGIENIFGHILEVADGLNIYFDGTTLKAYVCNTPANYAFDTETNYEYIVDLANTNGALLTMNFDSKALMLPLTASGTALSQRYCDYHTAPSSGGVASWKAVYHSGDGDHGARAGLFHTVLSYANTGGLRFGGARLCYIP